MSKYCFNCGYQLPDNAKFCINCGQKQVDFSHQSGNQQSVQPTPKTNQVWESNSSEAIDQGNTNQGEKFDSRQLQDELSQGKERDSTKDAIIGMVSKDFVIGPLMKEENVINKKVELGYPANPNNFVFTATPINWSDMLTVSGLTGMKSQNYIMSFEKNGILMMGCDGLVKFNDDNHFIKNEDVTKIDLEKYWGGGWDHMYLTVSDEPVEILVMKPTLCGVKWHSRNFKNVLMYTM